MHAVYEAVIYFGGGGGGGADRVSHEVDLSWRS